MKILYIHNKAMWYRLPYFNKLNQLYDMKFVFTDEDDAAEVDAPCVLLKSRGRYPLSMTPGLVPLLMREDFDLLVFPSIVGPLVDHFLCLFFVKLRRKPYAWGSDRFYHKKTLLSAQGVRNRLSDGLFRVIARCADAYFIPSEKHKAYPRSLGVSAEKLCVIPNASSIPQHKDDVLEADRLRVQLNLEGKKVILFVGRLIRIKGLDYLLHAFREVRKREENSALLIVGDEYFRRDRDYVGDDIKALCNDLSINDAVRFIGNVAHDKLGPYYALSDMCVLPSITAERREAWGLVLNEAMLYAKPVIASDAVGAASALIRHGVNGFIVPEKDSDALADAIVRVLSDPSNAKKMGQKSKEIIESGFTYDHMAEAFKAMVNKVISNRQAKSPLPVIR